MILGGTRQIDEDRAPSLAASGSRAAMPLNVEHAGGIVGAQGVPQVVEGRDSGGVRLSGGGRGEGVELQRADIGPTPLLFAGARPREGPEPPERLTAAVDEPCGFVAPLEEAMEGVLGEATDLLTRC